MIALARSLENKASTPRLSRWRQLGRSRSVDFFASSYRLQSLVVQPDGGYRAAAVTNEEGETGASRDVIALKLLAPTLLKVWTEAAGAHTYVRCASDAPAR